MSDTDAPVNIRAASYYLAATVRRCWRCGADTRVHGFALPPGHQRLYIDDDPAQDCWEEAEEPSLLSYLAFLAPGVVARMRARTPHYQLRYSATLAVHYWMNACEHCGAKLGDCVTFDEPGQGFLAFRPEEAARITLTRIDEPFAADCGSYSIGIEFFEYMQRA